MHCYRLESRKYRMTGQSPRSVDSGDSGSGGASGAQAHIGAIFEADFQPGSFGWRHPQEGDEIDGIVDIDLDHRLADDERVDPTVSRRIEMRIEAVFAETQRTTSGG
jgi:hypothetical protein